MPLQRAIVLEDEIMAKNWFTIDKAGFAALVKRRNPAFVFYELIANAWDAGSTIVNVTHSPVPGQPLVNVTVVDNAPGGFEDMSLAYTLYASTDRRSDPGKRGRFTLGEKEVLSLCKYAVITSVGGGVRFSADGTRRRIKSDRVVGTEVFLQLRMTREEYAQAVEGLDKIIVPEGITMTVNAVKVDRPDSAGSFEIPLPTELADEEGNLRKTVRKARVDLFETASGEQPWIYEMGVPVCMIGCEDPYHVDIQQKVPLGRDRDAVTPGYLHKIRVAVLNEMHRDMNPSQLRGSAVSDAIDDADADPQAVNSVLDARFGPDSVVYDPNDREANATAAANGVYVISGGSLSKRTWETVRKHTLREPAGRRFPTKSPQFSDTGKDITISRDRWDDAMRMIAQYVEHVGSKLIRNTIHVQYVNTCSAHNGKFGAWYGDRVFTINVPAVGGAFFHRFPNNLEDVDCLMLHELGHEYADSHLSEDYYKALTRLNREYPEWFQLEE